MTVAIRKQNNLVAPDAARLLTATAFGSTPYAPGGYYVVSSIGPLDLLAGDTVLVDATVQVTRPMPGDAEGAWRWYVDSGQAWEGAFAEDHNPAAFVYGIIRANDPGAAVNASKRVVAEYNPARLIGGDNVLQYQHHHAMPRSCQDFITADLPGRFYNFIVAAAHTKAGAPAGTFVKVDYAQMQVVVIR